jgi:hypothetical protein
MSTVPDFDQLTSGPALFLLDDDPVSHTQGSIRVTVNLTNRLRKVDQFGESAVAVVHQGDEVRISAPFAEWTARVLQVIYGPGNDQTAASGTRYKGIGRSAGFIYPSAECKIIPRLTADQHKRAVFWRVVPVGGFELDHSNEDRDRIFEQEFVCLVDPAKPDGELLGRLQLSQ